MVIPIQPTIPLFQGNEYDIWSIKMKTLLMSEDLWELVDEGYVDEEIPMDAIRDVRNKDAKVLFFIQQAIAGSIFPQISKATKSKEAWDALQREYQSPTKVAPQDEDGGQADIPLMDDSVYEAAAKWKIDVLKKIHESEFHVLLSPKHNTILHIASEFGQTECVEWILKLPSCSSILQRPNLNGDTPLHLAAGEGYLKVVQALINAAKALPMDVETGIGADKVMLRMINKGKDTALHEAVRYGNSNVVKLLIEEDPEFMYGSNDSGTTPLYMAVERGFTDIVKIMIEKSKETGTSLPYTGIMGRTALHAAVTSNQLEMTKMILEWKSDLTKQVDENGWSPLHCAAERGCDSEIVRELLKTDRSAAYLRSKDGNKTALHIASFHHHKKVVEEILSRSPGCREQVDDKGNNVFHFAMMKKGDHNYNINSYLRNKWLGTLGLVNEKDAQGNTPLHLLSSYQIRDVDFIWNRKLDKKTYNNRNMTAYDIILRAKEDISGKKDQIQNDFEECMAGSLCLKNQIKLLKNQIKLLKKENQMRDDQWEEYKEKLKKEKESKEYKGKYTSELRKQGETHLIVSALITTVTFAAAFTLPGGYKEDDGKAILSKKAAFIAFVVTDAIAMMSSLCAVFLHFFMTICKGEEFLRKHLLWAFVFTMIGMGAMALAFATGLYVVLPHFSALSIFTCILCSCFFLSFIVEYRLFWRGLISDMVHEIIFWLEINW